MKIEITELFKIVTPDEGKLLYNGDVYSELIYTPLTINPEDYWEEVNIEDVPTEETLNMFMNEFEDVLE